MTLDDSIKRLENNVLRQVTPIYLHTFEQILSLYRYALNNLRGDAVEQVAIAQRLRFTGVVKKIFPLGTGSDKEKVKVKLKTVLDLIDSGCKTLDILSEVKANSQLFTEHDIRQMENLLEKNSILFPKSYDTHSFSFYAMHTLLENPLLVLQKYLMLPTPHCFFNRVVFECLNHYLRRAEERLPFQLQDEGLLFLYHINNGFENETVELSSMVKRCSSLSININNFERKVIDSISNIINDWSAQIMSQLFPFVDLSMPQIDSLLYLSSDDGKKYVSINERELKRLCLLGQSDMLGDLISRKLKSLYLKGDNTKNEILHDNKNVLIEMDAWFKKCRMGSVTGISQIPGQIAAIVYSRIYYAGFVKYVLCSETREYILSDKNKVEKTQQLTTDTIKKVLFWSDAPFFSCPKNPLYRIDDLSDDLFSWSSDKSSKLPNNIMKDWIVYDKKTTRDRFKRPLKAFNDSLGNSKGDIFRQQQKTISHQFPIFGYCLRPFWCLDQ